MAPRREATVRLRRQAESPQEELPITVTMLVRFTLRPEQVTGLLRVLRMECASLNSSAIREAKMGSHFVHKGLTLDQSIIQENEAVRDASERAD